MTREQLLKSAMQLLEQYPDFQNSRLLEVSYNTVQEIIMELQNPESLPESLQKDPDILEILEDQLEHERRFLSDFNDIDKIFASNEWSLIKNVFPGTTEEEFIAAADTFLDSHRGQSYSDFFNMVKNTLPHIPDILDIFRGKFNLQEITFTLFLFLIDNETTTKPEENTITTIGNRLMLLSDPEFQNSFTTRTESNSGIFILDSENKQHLALSIDYPFLEGLLKATYISYLKGNPTGHIRLYYPDIAREMGIDSRKESDLTGTKESSALSRKREMEAFIIQVQQIYGRIPGEEENFQLLNVPKYNEKTEILEFTSPYMMKLIRLNEQKMQEKIKNGKRPTEWKCDLMHSTAANERNKSAIEMAQRILVGVQQRGTTKPDSKLKQYQGSQIKNEKVFTWHITCKGLINDCPLITNLLNRQKSTSNKTHILQHAFKAMYKILRTKSDLYDYYLNLSITETIPTYSTLNKTTICITHYGRNPDYQRPQIDFQKE